MYIFNISEKNRTLISCLCYKKIIDFYGAVLYYLVSKNDNTDGNKK